MSGRYELGEFVAAGGMADVYEGRDRMLDRRVAVKRLRGSVVDPAARERFTREAQVLAGFQHPNSVKVYDAVDDDDDGAYIVMEMVEGETLRQCLRRRGTLPIPDATAIADQLLAALSAAHRRGIVHRDVKPANVLITTDGQVKLADFGIATMTDATELTMHGQVIGTPKYLSPEQAVGERATPASDLYAVGVLLYEMVAGHAPFDSETSVATLSAHVRAPVPSLAAEHPDVPGWFAAVVTRALAKDPADRFRDATSMRAALLAGEDGIATAFMPAASGRSGGDAATVTLASEESPERPSWLVPALLALVVLVLAVAAWTFAGWGDASRLRGPTATTSVDGVLPTAPATTPDTLVPTVPPTVVPTAPPPTPIPQIAPAPGAAGNRDKTPPGQAKKGRG